MVVVSREQEIELMGSLCAVGMKLARARSLAALRCAGERLADDLNIRSRN